MTITKKLPLTTLIEANYKIHVMEDQVKLILVMSGKTMLIQYVDHFRMDRIFGEHYSL